MRRGLIVAGLLGAWLWSLPVMAQNGLQPYTTYDGGASDHGAPANYAPPPVPVNNGYAAPSGPMTVESRLGELENQLRQLNGRLEQSEWQNKQLRAQLEKLQGDDELRFAALEQKARSAPPAASAAPASINTASGHAVKMGQAAQEIPEENSAETEDRDAAVPAPGSPPVAGQLGNLYVADGTVKGADNSAKTPRLPKTPPGYGLTPHEQYDQAFGLLRAANYDEAERAFKSFVEKNPQDKLIDNAKYWLGETYYVRGKFDAAAVAFADAYQTAPKGSKAPDSVLKLGLSLAGMGRHDDACTTLAEVKNKFPGAPPAIKARGEQEMKKMKCK